MLDLMSVQEVGVARGEAQMTGQVGEGEGEGEGEEREVERGNRLRAVCVVRKDTLRGAVVSPNR